MAYLAETDPDEKRYLMCHCVLAREAVKSGAPDIPMEWCYCSVGYGKLRYDVAFGVDTEVEYLRACSAAATSAGSGSKSLKSSAKYLTGSFLPCPPFRSTV